MLELKLKLVVEVLAALTVNAVQVCIAKYLHSSELEALKSQARPQQAPRPASSWEASAESARWKVVLWEV